MSTDPETSTFPKVADPLTLISNRQRYADPGHDYVTWQPRRAGGPGQQDDTPGTGSKGPGRTPEVQPANLAGASYRVKSVMAYEGWSNGQPAAGGYPVRGPHRRTRAEADAAGDLPQGRVYRAPATGPRVVR